MKKFKLNYLFSVIAIVLSSGLLVIPPNQDPAPIDPFEMGQRLALKLADENIDKAVESLTDLELWSTIVATDSLLEFVYKPSTLRGDLAEDDIEYDINSPDFQNARTQVLNLLQSNNKKSTRGPEIIYEGDEDPILVVKVDSYNSVTALRRSSNVQSISLGGLTTEEEAENQRSGQGFTPGKNKSFLDGLGLTNGGGDGGESRGLFEWFGCKNNAAPYSNLLPDHDGTVRVPWHYDELGIIEANECTAGAGIKVALLDTGVSEDQIRLSTNGFKATFPSRSITKISTVNGGVHDKCGHGTLMAGVLAGPQYDVAVRGVAYESNLVSIRSNTDVLLLTWFARNNLRQALKKIRKNQSGTSGTKVVSMSLGYLSYSPSVAFELKKVEKKGKLMFGAIGTDGPKWFQVYPAKSKRVTGVTGVYSGYPIVKKRCDNCHWGNKVEFVVPMQLESEDGTVVTHSLMMEDELPAKVGGSSIATATMAGIAAMVWALPQNQNKNGKQIKDILRAASSSPNSKHPKFGHGVVNVLQATGCLPPDPCIGVVCPSGQQCVGGNCITIQGNECTNVGDCPPGTECLNGYCVLMNGDACGPNFPACPQGYKCIGGNCIEL